MTHIKQSFAASVRRPSRTDAVSGGKQRFGRETKR